jgi:hypothetical protein
MKTALYALALLVALPTIAAPVNATTLHPISIAIDPRSSGEAQAELITNGFRKYCPDVAIVRDEAAAQYVLLASESNPLRGFLLHYYITIYDSKGTVVFSVDKNHDKSATKAACKFITDAGGA